MTGGRPYLIRRFLATGAGGVWVSNVIFLQWRKHTVSNAGCTKDNRNSADGCGCTCTSGFSIAVKKPFSENLTGFPSGPTLIVIEPRRLIVRLYSAHSQIFTTQRQFWPISVSGNALDSAYAKSAPLRFRSAIRWRPMPCATKNGGSFHSMKNTSNGGPRLGKSVSSDQ